MVRLPKESQDFDIELFEALKCLLERIHKNLPQMQTVSQNMTRKILK